MSDTVKIPLVAYLDLELRADAEPRDVAMQVQNLLNKKLHLIPLEDKDGEEMFARLECVVELDEDADNLDVRAAKYVTVTDYAVYFSVRKQLFCVYRKDNEEDSRDWFAEQLRVAIARLLRIELGLKDDIFDRVAKQAAESLVKWAARRR